ncbi:MAG: Holliday junction resolvase RuvX [Methylacidiphilales bacterium]|nr:Holliday junction resolvase RuvX [Candidatus Methylacidiphilales bacterium]MDW8349995.1 Holliday junction resolvase RuvX [Verrucomicrobiae bacterium]
MKNILALDLGAARVGLAYADAQIGIPLPLPYLPAQPWDAFLSALKKIVAEKSIHEIVVGLPLKMDGTSGPAAQAARQRIQEIHAATALPVYPIDERLSTLQASRQLQAYGLPAKKQKQHLDSSAALILLQAYLDRHQGPPQS